MQALSEDQAETDPALRREARRQAILDGATAVFVRHGYAGCSIDKVIERVGGSKRTLYREFGNKEGLFAAIVRDNVRRVLEPLTPQSRNDRDLHGTLLAFGYQLMRLQLAPPILGLYRMVVAEGLRFPQLARIFYEAGPGKASERLAEVLAQHRAAGSIPVADCRRAADHFAGLLRDNLHLRVVLGLQAPPGEREQAALVESAVELFMNGETVSPP